MLNEPVDILKAHPIRKTKAQKEAFRVDLQAYVKSLGYAYRIESGSMGVNNIVIGDPKRAKYLVTAHYDTPANKRSINDNSSGVITALEIARTMPEIHRNKVCFVLFDLGVGRQIGSSSYRKAHMTETENQILLNLDCVGDGDHIMFFPTKKAKKNAKLMQEIHRLGGWFGSKHIQLKMDGFYTHPSDQKNFPVGIGIGAFHKAKLVGSYIHKNHTKRDTVLEETNVNLLRAALTTLICGDAVNKERKMENESL